MDAWWKANGGSFHTAWSARAHAAGEGASTRAHTQARLLSSRDEERSHLSCQLCNAFTETGSRPAGKPAQATQAAPDRGARLEAAFLQQGRKVVGFPQRVTSTTATSQGEKKGGLALAKTLPDLRRGFWCRPGKCG